MAAEHVEDAPFIDEDDDMPPLVDNPYPSMTFTFAANMTPITYSTDQNSFELTPEATAPGTFMYEPPPFVDEPTAKTSHSKKKDESYIPRPPNAFILFRSSFIKAQHIPEKIEDNHCALSKIIGKYWKTLPRPERQVWEAKAIVALAEHRKKYPDWRFRPGANGLGKVKDGPRRKNNRKGRGETEKKVRNREKRCDKIADLLVAGKKGEDLEAAIRAYDSENVKTTKVEDEGGRSVFVMHVPDKQDVFTESKPAQKTVHARHPEQHIVLESLAGLARPEHEGPRCSSVDISAGARFDTPLTAMFKRSSSAPASYTRLGADDPTVPGDYLAARRHSVCSLDSSTNTSRYTTASPPVFEHEVRPRAEYGVNATGNVDAMRDNTSPLSPLRPHLLSLATVDQGGLSMSHGWNNTSPVGSFEPGLYSPTLPAFVPDIDDNSSPIHSPLTSISDIISDGDYVPDEENYIRSQYVRAHSSYSSLNGWAGDGLLAKYPPSGNCSSPYVVTPQSPAEYDPERIMRDAFEAASFAPFDIFGHGLNPIATGVSWANTENRQHLEHYEQGLEDINCRYGDHGQLFSYNTISAY
ncbi:hypothetical protein BDY19DRAFT_938531 [Irpex rosettiformis]|uniref:Uncharacterized protein n=1 Tax=Irpex rosettiformis TaxID=378272 RepID=A0ACB8U752_9APHY|nr:hypothetical protein BDY19DRAFT_938531 [Irpex rosettiformis]